MNLFDKVKKNQKKFQHTTSQDVKEANIISKKTDKLERQSFFKTDNVV